MKTRNVGLLVLMVMVMMVAGALAPALAGPIELKYAGLVPPGTTYSDPVDEWGKKVAERTNGRVKMTPFHAQALGKWTEFPKMLKFGVCDMAFVAGGSPGFQLLGLAELPAYVTSQRISMDMLNAMYQKGLFAPAFEKSGFKLMFFMNSPSRIIFLRNKEITQLSDLKGLKLRGISPQHLAVAKALGASPVRISSPEMYMALDRGAIDGSVDTPIGMIAMKWVGLVKHCLWAPVSTDVMAVAMSLKTWNKLPADVQVVIQQVNNEMRYRYLEYYKTDQQYQEILKKAGVTIHYLDAKEKATLARMLAPVKQEWINKMEERGVKVTALDKEMSRVLSQY